MKSLTLILPLLLATGCSSADSVQFDLRSTLMAQTNGVVLQDQGSRGNAGMGVQTCSFDAFSGEITGDLDLPGDDERVLDGFEGDVLAASAGRLFRFNRGLSDSVVSFPVDAIDAAFLSDGLVSLERTEGHCQVRFSDSTQDLAVNLDSSCDSSVGFAVDRAGNRAFVATGEVFFIVERQKSLSLEAGFGADLVSFDPVQRVLFVGIEGESIVRAIDESGAILWTVDVEGVVRHIGDMGEVGAVSVMVDREIGGELVIIDAVTGDQVMGQLTPDIAEVTVSTDGGTVALSTPDQVHFYDVRVNDGSIQIPTIQPVVGGELSTNVRGIFAD